MRQRAHAWNFPEYLVEQSQEGANRVRTLRDRA